MKYKIIKLLSAVIATVLLCCTFTTFVIAGNSSNYATNKESWQIRYDGYLQFVPAYKTTSSSGYYLTPDKNVCQGYINYTRDGKSVSGGRQYTSRASSITSYNTYWVKKTVWDTLNPFAEVTKFFYGWVYF